MEIDLKVCRVLQSSALAIGLIGLMLLLYANQITGMFVEPRNNQHFAVYLGTALIGFAVINWLFARRSKVEEVLPVLYGNLVSLVLAFGIDAVLLAQGEVSKMVWLILLLHAVFGAAFGYCIHHLKDLTSK